MAHKRCPICSYINNYSSTKKGYVKCGGFYKGRPCNNKIKIEKGGKDGSNVGK